MREEETYRQKAGEDVGKGPRNWEEMPGPAVSSGSSVLRIRCTACSLGKGLEGSGMATYCHYLPVSEPAPLKEQIAAGHCADLA